MHREQTGQLKFTRDTSDLLQRVFSMRGIDSENELSFDLKCLHPVSALKGIDHASRILSGAIQNNQRILIIGDFDADGATATVVAIRALRMMGHQQVDYLVPNRFEYGYGLTPEIVLEAEKFKPDLIITVDNGISSVKGVDVAKSMGYQVIITDHHLPGKILPSADAIINPNQHGDDFPSKNLAGVGVIFYLMLSLKNALLQEQYFESNNLSIPNLTELLDLVALGTVADVVPLDQNNRILVEQGLRRMRGGHCCAGISALFQIARRNVKRAVSSDLGFVCGPRLNAAGRLDDMSLGIECLLSENLQDALNMASALDDLNIERRAIEESMKAEALDILEELDKEGFNGDIPPVLCLFKQNWHQGVVGILAARIRERYHRPTIIFAAANDIQSNNNEGDDSESKTNTEIKTSTEIKGSARSIPGLHIRDILDEVATANPELLDKFGGHAMAAGLSLQQSNFEAFVEAITHVVEEHSDEDTFNEIQHSDGELTDKDFELKCADELRYAAPWGQHFPAPVFDNRFLIVQKRVLKEKHLKLVLRPVQALNNNKPGLTRTVQAIAFNVDIPNWPDEGAEVHLLYRLDVNEYQETLSLQLMVEKLLEG